MAEGEISELHVGLKGTMNALFLKDLAKKTHRGMRGRVEQGKAGGGLCYGYDVVRRLEGAGNPVTGERTINEAQAAVVRRVFRDYAAGVSPQLIARRLNDEGIPGPEGQLWSHGTLRGHARRGTGFLNNELYIGRLVWNRQRYVKDPSTGKRVSRINPESEWITTEVPDLRIIDDGLWQAAKARQASIAVQYAGCIEATRKAVGMRGTVRPKSLLSGLVFCGVCGGPCSLRGQGRFACSSHNDTGACKNGRSITRLALESRVLDGLRDRLMAPEMVSEAIDAYVAENNRLNHDRRASHVADTAELSRVVRSIGEVLDAIEQGRKSDALFDRLEGLEGRQKQLKARLGDAPADVPDIHPNIAEIYRRKVARLAEALNHPADRDEASYAIRSLIERVTLHPGQRRGEIHATLHGEFGAILEWMSARNGRHDNAPVACATEAFMSSKLVAGTRFHLNLRARRPVIGTQLHDAMPSPALFPGLFATLA
ncbi:recombinase family protein [Sphingomonas profundi]|uniref:recombinase family protein n=1 Tax=Alterirhizorhabdus profundi TaxID=2681549 RepID=UPI001E5FBDD2|nr:recombinase family protein [Sphingomonas profundi]